MILCSDDERATPEQRADALAHCGPLDGDGAVLIPGTVAPMPQTHILHPDSRLAERLRERARAARQGDIR